MKIIKIQKTRKKKKRKNNIEQGNGGNVNFGTQNTIGTQINNYPYNAYQPSIKIKNDIDILCELIEIIEPIRKAHQDTGMSGILDMAEFDDAKFKLELYENDIKNVIKDTEIEKYEQSLIKEFKKLCKLVNKYAACRANACIMITDDENSETGLQYANFENKLHESIKFVKKYKRKTNFRGKVNG